MSVHGNFLGGVEKSSPTLLTTTAQTDIYTGYDRGSVAAAIGISNEDAAGVLVKIHYFDGSSTKLIWIGTVAAQTTAIVSDIPIRLYKGDIVKATAATANKVTVTPIIIRSHANEPTPAV